MEQVIVLLTQCILYIGVSSEKKKKNKPNSVKEEYWAVRVLTLPFLCFGLGDSKFEVISVQVGFLLLLTFCLRPKRNIQGLLKNHWETKGKGIIIIYVIFPLVSYIPWIFFWDLCSCCYYNYLNIANLRGCLWYHKKWYVNYVLFFLHFFISRRKYNTKENLIFQACS